MKPQRSVQSIAILTLSTQGARVAAALMAKLPQADLFVHDDAECAQSCTRFARVLACTEEIFAKYDGLIYIMPTGVVVRAVAPHVEHKLADPAVVVTDVAGRWAISLLSGHEGGANTLALTVGNILRAEPVVTTTTEAEKDLIVGVGCRQETPASDILSAIEEVLDQANLSLGRVRYLASAEVKEDEAGLLEAGETLNIPIRFLGREEINNSPREFAHSEFVQDKVGLLAVAEPAALLAGRRTQLLIPKQTFKMVTVAVARERCL